MLRSRLENRRASHSAVLDKFKQREDVKLYIQLPDYDDFQCYDLGRGGHFTSGCSANLFQFPQAFMANFKTSLVSGWNSEETSPRDQSAFRK